MEVFLTRTIRGNVITIWTQSPEKQVHHDHFIMKTTKRNKGKRTRNIAGMASNGVSVTNEDGRIIQATLTVLSLQVSGIKTAPLMTSSHQHTTHMQRQGCVMTVLHVLRVIA